MANRFGTPIGFTMEKNVVQLYAYVHADVAQTNPDFFLQIGSDSVNYYEFLQTVSNATPDPGYPGWYEIHINLDSLATIKYQSHKTRFDTSALHLAKCGLLLR